MTSIELADVLFRLFGVLDVPPLVYVLFPIYNFITVNLPDSPCMDVNTLSIDKRSSELLINIRTVFSVAAAIVVSPSI